MIIALITCGILLIIGVPQINAYQKREMLSKYTTDKDNKKYWL